LRKCESGTPSLSLGINVDGTSLDPHAYISSDDMFSGDMQMTFSPDLKLFDTLSSNRLLYYISMYGYPEIRKG
jgi:hypothetical protein